TLPEICIVRFEALSKMNGVVAGLEVDPERMAKNLEATRGLIFAEAVMFALAPRLGRDRSKRALDGAMARMTENGSHLRDELLADPDVHQTLTAPEIDRLFDPRAHLGQSQSAVSAVIEEKRP